MTDKAIICVDDEDIVLESLKEQLERNFGSEFIYEVAESANEGLEIIEELVEEGIKICIIVSDWLMPGIKGDEFLIEVHKKYPQIVKVLLTGQATQSAIERAKERGGLKAVLTKPWEEKKLVRLIETSLN